MTEANFIVTIKGSETPPGWIDQIEKKLRRDLELSFGVNAEVRKTLPPPAAEAFKAVQATLERHVHVAVKPTWSLGIPARTACGVTIGHGVSWTTEPGRYGDVTCLPCKDLISLGLK